MNARITHATLLICAAIFAAGVSPAGAGNLNPPVGPVAPTHKTLTEVEPRIAVNATTTPGDADSLYKITQPGSYYLTGNIQGVVGKHGVEIATSGVTLDLNGFELRGTAGSLDGVSATVIGLTCVKVLNGSVRSWGEDGVDLGAIGVNNCRVEGVLASGNAGYGIVVGQSSIVSHCSASLNTASGFLAGDGCTLSDCSASSNANNGFIAKNGCALAGCSANNNAIHGITAINGCTVSNCAAYHNTTNGINATLGSAVVDCSSKGNTENGIECFRDCVIRGNTCDANGSSGDGAGIQVGDLGNRIEGNNCTGADRGIGVNGAGNIIFKNTCSGNTIDWVIPANNVFGPIIDRRSPASAAVSGFSSASSLGSTDPNANFSY